MGTWSRNFLVPKGDPQTLRDTLVGWLERKGFDLAEKIPPFTDPSDDSRALCLVSNAHWTIILYRESFEEGDRLLSELDDLPVLLEVLIADSDIWGYDLIEKGELTASFNSNPSYFGGNSQKLPLNGDPARLCRALGLTGREQDIDRIQRRWSMFSDFPCQAFCRLIGASAAALTFIDFDLRNVRQPATRELAGWRIEPLYFERRRQFGEEPPPPYLHALAVRQFETQQRPVAIDPELVQYAKSMTLAIKVVSFPFRVIFWLLGPFMRWSVLRQHKKEVQGRTGDPLYDALCREAITAEKQDGPWLVNQFYACRLRATRNLTTNPLELAFTPASIFRFAVRDVVIVADALRSEDIRRIFQLQKDRSLVTDESFFTSNLPARHLALRLNEKRKDQPEPLTLHYWFIELPEFTLIFQPQPNQNLTPETVTAIHTTIQSFEQLPAE